MWQQLTKQLKSFNSHFVKFLKEGFEFSYWLWYFLSRHPAATKRAAKMSRRPPREPYGDARRTSGVLPPEGRGGTQLFEGPGPLGETDHATTQSREDKVRSRSLEVTQQSFIFICVIIWVCGLLQYCDIVQLWCNAVIYLQETGHNLPVSVSYGSYFVSSKCDVYQTHVIVTLSRVSCQKGPIRHA